MFGMPQIPYGMLGVAGGSDTRPTNTPEDMSSLTKALAAVRAQNQTANGRVARGFNQFGPQASQPAAPMLPTPPTPAPVDMSDPAPALSAKPAIPMPAQRPVQAPAPQPTGPADMGQAANIPIGSNYLMPAFGTASDTGAQATGPDVIQKLMSYFKNKDNPTNG